MSTFVTANQDERCGSCGAFVEVGSETCPICGALLAAYRNPLDTSDQVEADESPSLSEPAMPKPFRLVVPEEPASPETSDTVEPELVEARERLLRTLAAPEHDLVDVIEAHGASPPLADSIASPYAPPVPVDPASPTVSPEPRPIPARPVVTHQPPLPGRPVPRRPGFMVKGSPATPLTLGAGLLLVGCFLVLIVRSIDGALGVIASGLGWLMWLIGAVCIVFGMLVILVRRERDR